MTLISRGVFLGLLFSSLIMETAVAKEDDFSINASVGSQYFSSNLINENTILVALGGEYEFVDQWAAEASFMSSFGNEADKSFSQYYLNAIYYFTTDTSETIWRPYITVGAGAADQAFPGSADGEAQLNFGGGLRYFFNDDWSARVDLSGISGIDSGYFQIRTLLGVTYTFGGDKKELIVEDKKPKVLPPEDVPLDVVIAKPKFDPTKEKVIQLKKNFSVNSAKISDAIMQELFEIAELLFDAPNNYAIIETHTDSVGLKGDNDKLTKNQSEAIKKALVAGYGIDPHRLITRSYGSRKPAAANDTATGRKMNRRIIITITPTKPLR